MALRSWFPSVPPVSALARAACSDTSPEAPAVATPRPDGLTGAPLPAAAIESAEFDDSRLDADALGFPPLTNVGHSARERGQLAAAGHAGAGGRIRAARLVPTRSSSCSSTTWPMMCWAGSRTWSPSALSAPPGSASTSLSWARVISSGPQGSTTACSRCSTTKPDRCGPTWMAMC
jgi:hypothetical protein